jgi:hypothetical protein
MDDSKSEEDEALATAEEKSVEGSVLEVASALEASEGEVETVVEEEEVSLLELGREAVDWALAEALVVARLGEEEVVSAADEAAEVAALRGKKSVFGRSSGRKDAREDRDVVVVGESESGGFEVACGL